MKTPDFTPQAIAAFALVFLTNLLVLFGVSISDARKAAIETLLNGVAVIGFLAHDFLIRRSRAQNASQISFANRSISEPSTGGVESKAINTTKLSA